MGIGKERSVGGGGGVTRLGFQHYQLHGSIIRDPTTESGRFHSSLPVIVCLEESGRAGGRVGEVFQFKKLVGVDEGSPLKHNSSSPHPSIRNLAGCRGHTDT